MLRIIRRRERKERTDYFRCYDWTDFPGCGFMFPCDASGNVKVQEMSEAAMQNYLECVNGTMTSKSGAGVVDMGVKKSVSTWTEVIQVVM